MMAPSIIAPRFCGPPGSGNGGYVCGLIADRPSGQAEITLRAPPPLATPITVERRAEGSVRVLQAAPLYPGLVGGCMQAEEPAACEWIITAATVCHFRARTSQPRRVIRSTQRTSARSLTCLCPVAERGGANLIRMRSVVQVHLGPPHKLPAQSLCLYT